MKIRTWITAHKKGRILLLCLALFLGIPAAVSLEGCIDKKQVQASPERVSVQRYAEFCRIQDTGYCLYRNETGEQYIYYYDNRSDRFLPLCGRPECTHDTPDCSAWIGEGLGLGVSCGMLCWIGMEISDRQSGWFVYQMKTDGTGRERLTKLADINENTLPLTNHMILYDAENVYICGQRSEILDGKEIFYTELKRYPLGKGKPEVLCQRVCRGVPMIQIYKERMYLSITEQHATEQDGGYQLSSVLELLKYDTEDSREELLFEGELDFVPYSFYVLDDKILITSVSTGENLIYSYRFSDGTIQPEISFGEEENYDVLFLEDNCVIGYTYPDYPDFSVKKLRMTDFDGNVLYEEESSEKMLSRDGTKVFGRIFYGREEKGLYFAYEDDSEPGRLRQRIVRYSLKDGSVTKLPD